MLVVKDDPTSTLAARLGIARAGEVAPLPEDLLNRVRSPEAESSFVLVPSDEAIPGRIRRTNSNRRDSRSAAMRAIGTLAEDFLAADARN